MDISKEKKQKSQHCKGLDVITHKEDPEDVRKLEEWRKNDESRNKKKLVGCIQSKCVRNKGGNRWFFTLL